MSTKNIVVIGTRGSDLAMYQAHQVQQKIMQAFPGVKTQIEIIKTQGDKVLDVALSKIGDKGLFTKELELALSAKKVDLVVHSLKDLPTELDAEYQLAAVLERADKRDALVSKNHLQLHQLNASHTVATSSLRRKAELLRINPALNIVDIRGNVNTRLRKMHEGHCDAMIMAAAGLKRLGLEKHITQVLEPGYFMPAVSQGIIAIETLKYNTAILEMLDKINHQGSWQAAMAERAFMRTLMGGCQVPVGCYTLHENDQFSMVGFVASTDGKNHILGKVSGTAAKGEQMATELATDLLNRGGREILESIRFNH